jgi:hypothetical protein
LTAFWWVSRVGWTVVQGLGVGGDYLAYKADTESAGTPKRSHHGGVQNVPVHPYQHLGYADA